MQNVQATTISQYISSFPVDIQKLLEAMRNTISKAAPKATEAVKYGLPTFVQDGNLVHFGAFKKHIGFYPAPVGIEAFKKELEPYVSSKGAIQFPLDKPLPLALIKQIVQFRVLKNAEKALLKNQKGKVKSKK